ncbi:hypothetical protein ACLB2K_047630 [Fragaria x ananassa]
MHQWDSCIRMSTACVNSRDVSYEWPSIGSLLFLSLFLLSQLPLMAVVLSSLQMANTTHPNSSPTSSIVLDSTHQKILPLAPSSLTTMYGIHVDLRHSDEARPRKVLESLRQQPRATNLR